MLQRTPRFAACFPSASTRIIASNVNRISRITQRGERVFLSTVRRTATVTPSPIAERSIVTSVSVCLSVCLSRSLPNLLCMLHIAVARSSSGGVVTRYVLQVLWMTSYLRKQEVARRRRPAEAQCTRSLGLGYKLCAVIPAVGQRTHGTTFRALKVTSQVATAGAESAIYDCLVSTELGRWKRAAGSKIEIKINSTSKCHNRLSISAISGGNLE